MRYTIHEANMAKAEKKLTALKNKCEKYGCSFKCEVVGELFAEVEEGQIAKFFVLDVEGEAKVNGWRFVATVEHTEAGNIIRAFDHTVEIPEKYRTSEAVCEHCNSKRRRKDTYLIVNESGEFKQVGKSCLKDFTNGLTAEAIAAYVDFFNKAEEYQNMGAVEGYSRYYDTKKLIVYMSECVLKFGYRNRANSDEPTFWVAEQLLYGRNKGLNDLADKVGFNPENPAAVELAQKALEWAQGIEPSSDYNRNIKVVSNLEFLEYRDLGLLASIIPTYQKQVAYQKKTAADKEFKKQSKHVGNIGDRIEFEIESYRLLATWTTQWGFTGMYEILDKEGNVYIWKTSNCIESHHKTIKGTVKSHNEFNGVLQTELTRCSMK